MKTLFLIATIFLSSMLIKAQEIFFPSKEGVVLEYKNYDNKNSETGTTRYTITKVNKMGNDMDITYISMKIEKNKKVMFKDGSTIN